MVKTSRDTLFVHPLPAHLAKHVTSNDDVTPHLVYRQSLNKEDDPYKDDVLYPENEGERFVVKLIILITFPRLISTWCLFREPASLSIDQSSRKQ